MTSYTQVTQQPTYFRRPNGQPFLTRSQGARHTGILPNRSFQDGQRLQLATSSKWLPETRMTSINPDPLVIPQARWSKQPFAVPDKFQSTRFGKYGDYSGNIIEWLAMLGSVAQRPRWSMIKRLYKKKPREMGMDQFYKVVNEEGGRLIKANPNVLDNAKNQIDEAVEKLKAVMDAYNAEQKEIEAEKNVEEKIIVEEKLEFEMKAEALSTSESLVARIFNGTLDVETLEKLKLVSPVDMTKYLNNYLTEITTVGYNVLNYPGSSDLALNYSLYIDVIVPALGLTPNLRTRLNTMYPRFRDFLNRYSGEALNNDWTGKYQAIFRQLWIENLAANTDKGTMDYFQTLNTMTVRGFDDEKTTDEIPENLDMGGVSYQTADKATGDAAGTSAETEEKKEYAEPDTGDTSLFDELPPVSNVNTRDVYTDDNQTESASVLPQYVRHGIPDANTAPVDVLYDLQMDTLPPNADTHAIALQEMINDTTKTVIENITTNEFYPGEKNYAKNSALIANIGDDIQQLQLLSEGLQALTAQLNLPGDSESASEAVEQLSNKAKSNIDRMLQNATKHRKAIEAFHDQKSDELVKMIVTLKEKPYEINVDEVSQKLPLHYAALQQFYDDGMKTREAFDDIYRIVSSHNAMIEQHQGGKITEADFKQSEVRIEAYYDHMGLILNNMHQLLEEFFSTNRANAFNTESLVRILGTQLRETVSKKFNEYLTNTNITGDTREKLFKTMDERLPKNSGNWSLDPQTVRAQQIEQFNVGFPQRKPIVRDDTFYRKPLPNVLQAEKTNEIVEEIERKRNIGIPMSGVESFRDMILLDKDRKLVEIFNGLPTKSGMIFKQVGNNVKTMLGESVEEDKEEKEIEKREFSRYLYDNLFTAIDEGLSMVTLMENDLSKFETWYDMQIKNLENRLQNFTEEKHESLHAMQFDSQFLPIQKSYDELYGILSDAIRVVSARQLLMFGSVEQTTAALLDTTSPDLTKNQETLSKVVSQISSRANAQQIMANQELVTTLKVYAETRTEMLQEPEKYNIQEMERLVNKLANIGTITQAYNMVKVAGEDAISTLFETAKLKNNFQKFETQFVEHMQRPMSLEMNPEYEQIMMNPFTALVYDPSLSPAMRRNVTDFREDLFMDKEVPLYSFARSYDPMSSVLTFSYFPENYLGSIMPRTSYVKQDTNLAKSLYETLDITPSIRILGDDLMDAMLTDRLMFDRDKARELEIRLWKMRKNNTLLSVEDIKREIKEGFKVGEDRTEKLTRARSAYFFDPKRFSFSYMGDKVFFNADNKEKTPYFLDFNLENPDPELFSKRQPIKQQYEIRSRQFANKRLREKQDYTRGLYSGNTNRDIQKDFLKKRFKR